MTRPPLSARRSVLYVPASNDKALAKTATLACDSVIIDLEDAVAPDAKITSREAVRCFFAARPEQPREVVLRINALASPWGAEDLALAMECRPDAILLPKIDTPRDILETDDALDEGDALKRIRVWAMIETPKSMLNIGAIAELGRDRAARLECLVAGTNDLAKEVGMRMTPDRRYLLPALSQIVMAARAGGLAVLDGVSNDFRDLDSFAAECAVAGDMGFDGKTLIHPSQIAAANIAFSPTADERAAAQRIVDAFAAEPEKAVLSIDGQMVERLHLTMAERVLAKNVSETKR